MADPLKQICDELGVCKEEALFYLEGFRWDLNAAMEACRSKTLPPSESERAAAEERSRNEKIGQFLQLVSGLSAEEASKYLTRTNWNLDLAVSTFFEDTDQNKPNTETWYPEMFSGKEGGSDVMQDVLSKVPLFHNASMDLRIGNPPPSAAASEARPGIATAQVVKNFSGRGVDKDSSTESRQHIPEAKTLVTSSQVEKNKEELIASFSSTTGATRQVANVYLDKYKWDIDRATNFFFDHRDSEPEEQTSIGLMELLPTQSQFESSYVLMETQSSPEEAGEGDVTVPGMASSQVDKNLSGMAVDQDSSTEPLQHKPLVTSSQVEESGNPTEALPLKEEEYDEVKEEHIGSFVKKTGATREVAIAHLEHFKWDVNQAVELFEEHGYSAEVISALSLSLMENKDLNLPSMGFLPSQSQFESSYVPMETQSSPEEAGEGGDVTVAIPSMASSQVDVCVTPSLPHKGKAVEEGSSAETVPDPFANDRTTVETQAAPSTIMLTIRLADVPGTELKLPFRSNQTIRDIRNAIDQLYPDNDRGYFLQSMDGVAYMDWNTTVHRVTRGDCTGLLQTYP